MASRLVALVASVTAAPSAPTLHALHDGTQLPSLSASASSKAATTPSSDGHALQAVDASSAARLSSEPLLSGLALTYLNRAYSLQVYGAENQLDTTAVRILWPALLSASEQELLSPQCQPLLPSESTRNGPLLIEENGDNATAQVWGDFGQRQALWVHWSPEQIGNRSTIADNSWVEVVHCAQDTESADPDNTPMWVFVAPGSGVWLNTGRSLRMPNRVCSSSAICAEENAALDESTQRDGMLAHDNVAAGHVANASRVLGVDLDAYDSIQWINFSGAEKMTEIAFLKLLGENSSITRHLDALRCGPLEDLHECTLDHPALQAQALCAESPSPPVQRILERSGCV